MVKEFSISINQDTLHNSFVPGSAIAGFLIVEVDEPKNYKQIVVHLKGRGHVHWTTGSGDNRRTHSAGETYVDQEQVVWTSEHSSNGLFPVGRYTYPFELILPTNCPSSFQSHVGTISYMIEAVISTGALKFNHKTQHPFAVLELITINSPLAQAPVYAEQRKTVGCLCCVSGAISWNAQIEHGGFNMGDQLPLTYHVENGCGRRITVRYDLIEKIVYNAHGSRTQSTNYLARQVSEAIQPHSTTGNANLSLLIPHVRPAIKSSNIITSEFVVIVTLVIPRAINSVISIPVSIGNIDIHQQGLTRF